MPGQRDLMEKGSHGGSATRFRSVDEKRLVRTLGQLRPATMAKVDEALKISLALWCDLPSRIGLGRGFQARFEVLDCVLL